MMKLTNIEALLIQQNNRVKANPVKPDFLPCQELGDLKKIETLDPDSRKAMVT